MNQKFLDLCKRADRIKIGLNPDLFEINDITERYFRISRASGIYYVALATAVELEDKLWRVELHATAALANKLNDYNLQFIKLLKI